MPSETSSGQETASTLGWDTVFAVHIADLNAVIASRRSWPAGFSVSDEADGISMTGTFGVWQIVPGGSGGLLRMKIPFHDAVLSVGGKPLPPRSGAADIQLWLHFLDQDADPAPGAPRTLRLMARTTAGSNEEPVVMIHAVVHDGQPPTFAERTAFSSLLELWMDTHLDEFQHVFATVDINAAAAHDGFQWLQPTHVDYAYSDFGPDDGFLAVLCMTEGRPPAGSQQVTGAAIPNGQRGGFLISRQRLLEKLVLPAIPALFPGSHSSDYALSSSGDAIVTASETVSFTARTSDGVSHDARVQGFQLSLSGSEIRFGMTTRTDVSPGIRAMCRAENFLGIRLVDRRSGQTLEFYDVKPQIVTKWPENDPGFAIAETLLAVIAVIAMSIATIATAGTALAVAALVIGLLAGAAAGISLVTRTVIDQIGTDNAPTIGALLLNSTGRISWTGQKAFRLTSAGLNGALQLGGTMVPTED